MSLLPGERVDVLASRHIKIIQSGAVFSFSLDAVLLQILPRLNGTDGWLTWLPAMVR